MSFVNAGKHVFRHEITLQKDTVICRLHWPEEIFLVKRNGSFRPQDENFPSVFPGFSKSEIPSPPPPLRSTKKTSMEAQTLFPDQIDDFRKNDSFTFNELKEQVDGGKVLPHNVNAFSVDNDGLSSLRIQSQSLNFSIPEFILCIFSNLRYEAFYNEKKCHITTLTKNRILKIDCWSKLEEALRYLRTKEPSHKDEVIKQQLDSMGAKSVGEKHYKSDILVRSFEYYATSRSLFNKLRKDFELPEVSTLTKLTSKTKKIEDEKFLKSVFSKLKGEQKKFILLHDEIYV